MQQLTACLWKENFIGYHIPNFCYSGAKNALTLQVKIYMIKCPSTQDNDLMEAFLSIAFNQ